MIFVVVSNVAMPPKIVPKTIGISKRDEDILERRATPDITGNNKDAAAILFINRDNRAAAVITPKVRRLGPAPNKRTMNTPNLSVAPDLRKPSARIKADIMMITAERLNPENASWDVSTPLNPSVSINNNATISGRRTFPRSRNMAIPNNIKVIPICDMR
jgi:hypothetical protein